MTEPEGIWLLPQGSERATAQSQARRHRGSDGRLTSHLSHMSRIHPEIQESPENCLNWNFINGSKKKKKRIAPNKPNIVLNFIDILLKRKTSKSMGMPLKMWTSGSHFLKTKKQGCQLHLNSVKWVMLCVTCILYMKCLWMHFSKC